MGYDMVNNIDEGYFRLIKRNKANKSINYLLNKHNIDLDDYLLMKSTSNFRFIGVEDIEKYAGVICFKKHIFKKQDIELWIDFLYKDLKIDSKFLNRPFPSKEIYNKIKIVEDGV